MKFKFFNSDGSANGDKEVANFPILDDEKGVDALRQSIIAVHANQRQGNQKERIKQGVKSGELTKKETKQVVRQQRDIQRTKKAAKADGVVTKKEKAVINKKQNKASRNIRRKKNNGKSRK